ncbi:hypothetical protein OnM2_032088, partial [Erysiphe neolycopersici]
MRIIVPSPTSNPSSSPSSLDESFISTFEFNPSSPNNTKIKMTGPSQVSDTDMGEASANPLQGLSAEDIQDLIKLLAEKR